MSTWRSVQEAFTAGEVSPLFRAQQSSDLYRFGLGRCRNAICLTQGAVTSRPGTLFLDAVPDNMGTAPTNARCIPIEITQEAWAVAVFGAGQVTLYLDENLRTGDLNLVENPDFSLGTDGWQTPVNGLAFVFPAIVNDEIVLISSVADTGAIANIQQTVVVVDAPAQDLVFEYRIQAANAIDEGAVVRVSVSDTAYGGDQLYAFTHELDVDEEVRVSVALPGTAGETGNIYIRVRGEYDSVGALATWNTYYINLLEKDVIDIPPVVLPTPYLDSQLDIIQFASNPYVQSTVFVHADHPPQELVQDPDTEVWTFDAIPFEDGAGTEPDWGFDNGYPSAVGQYQGRCVFAGSPGEPQGVWATSPGNWYDIELVASPTAADPMWWTLSDRGAIRWVHGQKSLIHGGSTGEHNITASTGLLQPGDIQASKHTAYGSRPIQAVDAGEMVACVGGDGRTLRGLYLDRDSLGWKGMELSWASEHITRPEIRRIANSRDPYQILWCPLSNGHMAAMSYEPTQNLFGWHRHSTLGEFVDSCNARIGNFDYTFFIVKRQVGEDALFYLEAIQEITSPTGLNYMDSYVRRHHGEAVSVQDGLDHLEGHLVNIVVDGVEQPMQAVIGGQVTISPPGYDVTVGLPYRVEIETLPAISPPGAGGLAAKKSWSEIGVRMVGSPAPIVNGIRQEEGSDDVTMVELGWDQYATITVEQDRPLPLTVTGIYGRLSTHDL